VARRDPRGHWGGGAGRSPGDGAAVAEDAPGRAALRQGALSQTAVSALCSGDRGAPAPPIRVRTQPGHMALTRTVAGMAGHPTAAVKRVRRAEFVSLAGLSLATRGVIRADRRASRAGRRVFRAFDAIRSDGRAQAPADRKTAELSRLTSPCRARHPSRESALSDAEVVVPRRWSRARAPRPHGAVGASPLRQGRAEVAGVAWFRRALVRRIWCRHRTCR
jgi:hypothetical protein